jgi:hypothetical protein
MSDEVVFIREESREMGVEYSTVGIGGTGQSEKSEEKIVSSFMVFRGLNRKAALDFLTRTPVFGEFVYVVVETPEGNFGKDLNGIYQEFADGRTSPISEGPPVTIASPLMDLGEIVVTPGAVQLACSSDLRLETFIARHAQGDWD